MIQILTQIRSFLGIVFNIVYTIVCSVLVIFAGFLNLQGLATVLIRIWAFVVMYTFGIRVRTRGESYLPETGGGILVFNHQSHFDIPAIMLSTRKNIRFGAKIELFKIPFFGTAMRKVGTLPITRENRSEVMKIYQEAEARFRQNILFVLAPEGTRQHEPALGRFKKGPFIFAINAQVPIIPCVIRGAYDVLPKNTVGINVGALRRTIEIEYLPPFPTVGMKAEDVSLLLDRSRQVMAEAYERITPTT